MERMCFYFDTKNGKHLFVDKNYITKQLKIYDRDNDVEVNLTEKERREINYFLENLKRTDLIKEYFC